MKLFKKKPKITVQYVTGKGVKSKTYTFDKHLTEKNTFVFYRNEYGGCIRVTVENVR